MFVLPTLASPTTITNGYEKCTLMEALMVLLLSLHGIDVRIEKIILKYYLL